MILPDRLLRNENKLCKASISIHPSQSHILTEMKIPYPALMAVTAVDVSLARDQISLPYAFNSFTDILDNSGKLVTHHARRLDSTCSPIVPLVSVRVRSADARDLHSSENVLWYELRLRNIFDGCTP